MPDNVGVNREPRSLVFGIVLIALGLVLLLDRLDVFSVRWDSLAWVIGLCLGGFLVVDGFMRGRRARVYWGGVLFFFSLYWVLVRWDAIYHHGFFVTPVVLLAFGLSFFLLYASDTNEYGLLFPAVLLTGVGVAMILWWLEYFEWYEVRGYVRTYWPLLLVIWGAALLLRRRKPISRSPVGPTHPLGESSTQQIPDRPQTPPGNAE